MYKRIFITGGAGFIGANLVKYLLDKGNFDITVYDNLSSCSLANFKKAIIESKKRNRVKFIKGDILDFKKLNRSLKGHHIVIHLAAFPGVAASLKNPKKCFSVNVSGTFNVLEAARINRIEKFIFASSNASLGKQKPPLNEKMLPQPISPYGATKLFGEALCSAYFSSYGIKAIVLRFSNVFGPYSEHKTSVVASFLRQARNKRALAISGSGNQIRDFIHAKDICLAIYLCLKNHSLAGETFHIATGKKTKILDLAKLIKAIASVRYKKNIRLFFSQPLKGEVRQSFSDIAKARHSLNFKPQIILAQGIKEMLREG